jgi:hypothetical protein
MNVARLLVQAKLLRKRSLQQCATRFSLSNAAAKLPHSMALAQLFSDCYGAGQQISYGLRDKEPDYVQAYYWRF